MADPEAEVDPEEEPDVDPELDDEDGGAVMALTILVVKACPALSVPVLTMVVCSTVGGAVVAAVVEAPPEAVVEIGPVATAAADRRSAMSEMTASMLALYLCPG